MNKRIQLRIEDGELSIKRLVPLVLVDSHTGIIIDTEDAVTDEDLNRGYGFGSFLLSITVDEIDYDQEVVEFLSQAINREYSSMGDLFGFTVSEPNTEAVNKAFGLGNCVNYASLNDELIGVPVEDCTIDLVVFKEMDCLS